MSPSWLQIRVPLLCREIVLRILLTSAIANFAASIAFLASMLQFGFSGGVRWFAYLVLPLLVFLHHILRLWPRRYWLVICEVLFSLGEAIAVGIVVLPQTKELLWEFQFVSPTHGPFFVLEIVSSFVMGISTLITFILLLCDILNDRGKSILHPYDFSAGLCQPGCQWHFIGGRFAMRKRFSTDNLFIQCVRGGFSILCLLAMLSLVFYAVVWQPVQGSARPGAKVFKIPVSDGDLHNALATNLGSLTISYIQAVIPVRNVSESAPFEHPTMTMEQGSFISHHYPSNTSFSGRHCQNSVRTGVVLSECVWPLIPITAKDTVDTLITIHFPGAPDDFRVYLGMTDSVDDILAHAEPIGISPGLNLHGWSLISGKERFSSRSAAAFGIPEYNRFAVINVHALSPDSVPSLPRDNNTATLRVTMQAQPFIEIQQEYLEGSVLNGFALVGGVWTLINGVFAAIFGSTLLLVLFGIKPLSIYGLVHFFRPGKGSLVDANYVLSPEERDRTMGIFREHLLDVDDAPSSQYHPITIPPQFSSHCNVGTQT